MDAAPLRALTVKQPLAWAIVSGIKRVENRSWRFPYPLGTTIAVHAGLKVVDHLPVDVTPPADFPRGAIVGYVDVVDQHHASECARPGSRVSPYCSPWAYEDQHHWVLANARSITEPVPCRGYLWLFVPPVDVLARLA